MESLNKQTRVRFSGGEQKKEAPDSLTERKIPERKKAQNWFRRQFSRQMSVDSDSYGGDEYATAVAAAAFAVNSIEDSAIANMRKKDGSDRSIPMRAVSDKKMPEKASGPSPSMKKTPTFADKHLNNFTDGKSHEKSVGPAPSIKKTPSFAEKFLKSPGSPKHERAAPKPDVPSTAQPAFPPTGTRRQRSTSAGIGETKADAWEKAELAKIKERYEKLKSTIQSWESKKKEKAKNKNHKTEGKLEQKRARASQRHRSDMESIDEIAGGARAQVEERRRNEELKVKKKAKKIRATGKLPTTCFCF